MSRWVENYNNHAFQLVWEKIADSVQMATLDDRTVVTHLEELSRLKKVVKYIDELLTACDPELVPISVWNSFNDQASRCLSYINNFNDNRNVTFLVNANDHLDNLLSYVRPYMVNGKAAAQAAGRAFREYSTTVTQEIEKLEEQVGEVIEDISTNLGESSDTLESIKKIKKEIDDFNVYLFDTGEESFKSRIENLYGEVDEMHTEICSYHDELLVGNKEEDSILRQVNEAKENILENTEDLEKDLKGTYKNISELKEFHILIFGIKNKETGVLEGGLEQELNSRITELNDFKSTQENIHKALVLEIESLLPGATSAGLASAYRDLRRNFSRPIKTYSCMFYIAIALLIIVSLVAVTENIGWLFINFIEMDNFTKLSTNFFHKLPILGPVVWLAIFASTRRNEAHRLQQEYAHKEAIAKSYQSFKKQVDSLNNNETLSSLLLDTAIRAIGFNASVTLNGCHQDRPSVDFVRDVLKKK